MTRYDAGARHGGPSSRAWCASSCSAPTGTAWATADGNRLVRSDREGRVAKAAELPEQRSFEGGLAFGPDGAAWSSTTVWSGDAQATELVRATTNGVVTFSPFPVPACERSRIAGIATASDGALWFADDGCRRLVRRGVDGALTVTPLGTLEPGQARARPGRRDVVPRLKASSATAAAPATPSRTSRTSPSRPTGPSGPRTAAARCSGSAERRCPLPSPWARSAAGGSDLWLAGGTRLFKGLDGGPCDDTGPKVTIRPKRLTLDQIRRGELRLIVREPAALEFYFEEHEFGYGKIMRKAGTWRVKPSRAVLRYLKHRRQFYFVLNATDANGIEGGTDGYIRSALTIPLKLFDGVVEAVVDDHVRELVLRGELGLGDLQPAVDLLARRPCPGRRAASAASPRPAGR